MKDVTKKLLMKMLNDVPSGTKKKIQFLQWEKNINENDEGRAMKFLCKKNQDESDEGRAIGSRKKNGFLLVKNYKMKVMKDVPSGQKRKIGFYSEKKARSK